MAHFSQDAAVLALRLQEAVGLEGKSLASLDVNLHVGPDYIVKTTVKFIEFTEVDQQEAITEVFEIVSELMPEDERCKA